MDSGLVIFWDGDYFSPFVSLQERLGELVLQTVDGVCVTRGAGFLAADLAAMAAKSGVPFSILNAGLGDQAYIAAELADADPDEALYSGSLPDDFEDHLEQMDHGREAVVVVVRENSSPEVMVVTGYRKRGYTPPRPL